MAGADYFKAFNDLADKNKADQEKAEREEAERLNALPPEERGRRAFNAALIGYAKAYHGRAWTDELKVIIDPVYDEVRNRHDGFIKALQDVLHKFKAADYLSHDWDEQVADLKKHENQARKGLGTPSDLKTDYVLNRMVKLLSNIEGVGVFSEVKKELEKAPHKIDWDTSAKDMREHFEKLVARIDNDHFKAIC